MDMGLAIAKEKNKMNLDPRTKLFALIVISMIMVTGDITGSGLYIGIALSIIPFVLLVEIRKYKTAIIYFILFAISVAMEISMNDVNGALSIIFLLCSGLVTRFLPGVYMGIYVIKSTSVGEFITAMKKMKISDRIVIPFTVMFRFIPTIIDENKSIGMAMRMRGISFGGNRKNVIELVEYRLIPIIMSTVRVGNELSAAALTKGLELNQRRTSICKIGFGVLDGVAFVITLLLVALYVMSKIHLI